MATINSNFESLAGATVPTTGNTNFTTVTVGTSNTLVTNSTVIRSGKTSSLRHQTASTNAQFVNWSTAGAGFGAGLQRWWRGYFNFNGTYPASTTTLIGVLTSGLGNLMNIRISGSTHLLSIFNAGGLQAVVGNVAPPSSGWFRLEGMVLPGTGTTDGQASLSMFSTAPDGTSADDTVSTTTSNFGTIAPALHFTGVVNSANGVSWYESDIAFSDTAAIGPDVTSANYTATQDDPAGLADLLSPLVTSDWAFTHAVTIG